MTGGQNGLKDTGQCRVKAMVENRAGQGKAEQTRAEQDGAGQGRVRQGGARRGEAPSILHRPASWRYRAGLGWAGLARLGSRHGRTLVKMKNFGF